MIFSSNKSFLFRKRITDEFWNHGYVIIVLNKAFDSSIRFYKQLVELIKPKYQWIIQIKPTSLSDSNKIWSYSDNATKNIIEVTFSKQWIHFLLSERWPPTSTILHMTNICRILLNNELLTMLRRHKLITKQIIWVIKQKLLESM